MAKPNASSLYRWEDSQHSETLSEPELNYLHLYSPPPHIYGLLFCFPFIQERKESDDLFPVTRTFLQH